MTATVIPGTNMAEGTETEEPDYPKCDAGSEGGGAIGTKVLGIADGRMESLRAAGRTHVRVGGEGVRDAGIGQQPAVWTVAERTPNERCECF